MSGFTTDTITNLTRSNVWTADLKELFEDELIAQKYVDWLTTFPDGDTWNQPSLGQHEVSNYAEDQPVKFTAVDTGNFTFTITEYIQSGTYITNKFKQDSYVAQQAMADFVPGEHRAIMKDLEVKILAAAPNGQTSANVNAINGANHRMIGSGANETIDVTDFAKIRYAFQKANVPMNNLVGIVDPSVEYTLSTLSNIVNLSFNPQWEGIVRDGISTGMTFRFNILGFDIYTSQNLKVNSTSETISGVTSAAGVNNLFFSATSGMLPVLGAVRQPPKVDTQYNMIHQRDEYVTTMRYGLKLHRPENLVVVVTDTDQVYV